MPEPLDAALAEVRALLLDRDRIRRAVAAGRRRGGSPRWSRAELRPVDLKVGPHLQVVYRNGGGPLTRNVGWGQPAAAVVDELLGEPFGTWYVESSATTLQLRVTKRGEAQVHRAAPVVTGGPPAPTGNTTGGTTGDKAGGDAGAAPHDRAAAHLLDPGDPLFDVIGGSAAKRRQVDAFLRALAATIDPAALPERVRVVDLGCGNAYLTFAAYRYLSTLGVDAYLTGVDVRADQRERNTALAARLGWADRMVFRASTILGCELDGADIVLALHACDTATDEALARAVGWRARYVLAAPCCHHDIAAQLRRVPGPPPYELLTRHGILRERFADVLTDALRAALLRLHGYRVEVVEFVGSVHTPRNLLLRAVRTDAAPTAEQRAEYAALVDAWRLRPALSRLLAAPAVPVAPPAPPAPAVAVVPDRTGG